MTSLYGSISNLGTFTANSVSQVEASRKKKIIFELFTVNYISLPVDLGEHHNCAKASMPQLDASPNPMQAFQQLP
jgi:hypothetical protein